MVMQSGRLGYRRVCRLAVLALLASSALWGCGNEALQSATRDAGEDFGAKGPTTRRDAALDLRPVDLWIPPETSCGNGALEPGEKCDDGNHVGGDGCTLLCQIETGWSCPTPGQSCQREITCGDGVLAAPESCDDGNTKDGDGCSGSCTIEAGWRCPVPGSRCAPICGDGMIVGLESCDDRNTVGGDGCSAICLVEPTPFTCGDGIVSGSEECDDGAANGDHAQSGCNADCTYWQICGDGAIEGTEACDLGAANGTVGGADGCTIGCQIPPYCGDGVVDIDLGEQCDQGSLNGIASDCSANCKIVIPL